MDILFFEYIEGFLSFMPLISDLVLPGGVISSGSMTGFLTTVDSLSTRFLELPDIARPVRTSSGLSRLSLKIPQESFHSSWNTDQENGSEGEE